MATKAHILIVDDDPLNIEILNEHLIEEGYDITAAEDGQMAWDILTASDTRFDVVLLDRMMPKLNGLDLLIRVKQEERFSTLPIIMQTAMGSSEHIREALQAGAYYHLTKPFEREILLAIVSAAVHDSQLQRSLREALDREKDSLSLLRKGTFTFRTLEEAHHLTFVLANLCPAPMRAAPGLSELLINAVEHGNLGITYSEKTHLVREGTWREEIEARLMQSPYASRVAHVYFERTSEKLSFLVQDEGKGFDWNPYLNFSPERAFDPHGRGISMARMMSFDALNYQGCGNTVMAEILLKDKE